METKKEESYETVDHPPHYNNYSVEVIEMMVRIYGHRKTIDFCEMNAFKYRMRAGTKPGQSAEEDFKKEAWYMEKAQELNTHVVETQLS